MFLEEYYLTKLGLLLRKPVSPPRHLHHKSEEDLGEASVGRSGHRRHWKPGWCQCHILQEYWPGLWDSMLGFCYKAYRCLGMYRKAETDPRVYSKNIWNWAELEEFPKLKIVTVFITSHLTLKIRVVSLCIFLSRWISRSEKVAHCHFQRWALNVFSEILDFQVVQW